MLAISFGLFASFWFALSMVLINRGVLVLDYFRGLLTNLGVNALFLWLYIWLFVDRIELWLPANLIFVLVGVFVPGIARFFMFKGMERLGASITSCLTNSTPLFATLFAVSFLHEHPRPTNLLGTFSIVAGIVALNWKGSSKTWRSRDVLFPLTAAFLFAARDNMVRFGLGPEVGDASDLSQFPGRFDLCLSVGVLEHFDRSETVALLREQGRCAGRVLIAIPTKFSRYTNEVTDERFYSVREFAGLVSEAGMTPVTRFGYGEIAATSWHRLLHLGLPRAILRLLQDRGYAYTIAVVGQTARHN